jgi:beta-glucosidase
MRWCVGIEDTAIGVPIRHSGRPLDEHHLTEHDRHFRADLDLAASLGVDGLRYGLPWYRVNPAVGEFRWELVDPVVEHASACGVDLIIDLVHYGTPAWLVGGFVDDGYPRAIEEYAGAFAERYEGVIRHYTPLNEPLITAAFCGETGGWPPHLTGPRGWTAVATKVARGIQLSTAAIRRAISDATIVHVEAAKVVRTHDRGLAALAATEQKRAWLPTDLVLGRIAEGDEMWTWLLDHGSTSRDLLELRNGGVELDVIGINYYPQYSERELSKVDDRVVQTAESGSAAALVRLLQEAAGRYERPVAVTETSYDGDDETRLRWLRQSTEAVMALNHSGTEVWSYTWWPLFDFVDWGISAGGYPLEDFVVRTVDTDGSPILASNAPSDGMPETGAGPAAWLRRMGLWRLEPDAQGLERQETIVAGEMRKLIRGSRQSSSSSSGATSGLGQSSPG